MYADKNQSYPGLQFNVAQLLKEPTGSTRSYDVVAEVTGQLDEDVILVQPISGHVRLLHAGQEVLVTGLLQTVLEKPCGRCLSAFTSPVTIELEEEFYPSLDIVTGAPLPKPEDADEATLIDEHHILDLWEVVRQEILLESESVRYCRPDCKGFCPHCGQDLNTGSCTCEDELGDPRWSALKGFKVEE